MRPITKNHFRPYLSENEPIKGCTRPIVSENPAVIAPSSNPEAPKS